jgi:hypothetical protein
MKSPDVNDTLRDEGNDGVTGRHDRAKEYKPNGAGTHDTTAVDLEEWDAGDDPGFIPPREWLLGNQFCRSFISSIVAAGGCGKSALRLLQFISLATGQPLCGQHVFKRCRVLILSLEDDRRELDRRIKAVLDHHHIDRSELKGYLFCRTAPKLAKLAIMKKGIRAAGPLEQQIRATIERRKIDLVSLDPFIKTHDLDENTVGDMNYVCELLAQMAIEFNIAVDSPHHVHKGTITPGDADSGRGSSGIRDAGRLNYTLVPMSVDEAEAYGINPDDRHDYIRLDPAKVNITMASSVMRNEGPSAYDRLAAMLARVILERDPERADQLAHESEAFTAAAQQAGSARLAAASVLLDEAERVLDRAEITTDPAERRRLLALFETYMSAARIGG